MILGRTVILSTILVRSVGCLAYQGHEVIGVYPVGMKKDLINRGWSLIVECYCPIEDFGDSSAL